MNSLLHLVYPSLCGYCHDLLESRHKILCPSCSSNLTLMDAEERCIKCFTACQSFSGVCKQCQKRPTSYLKMAACFDHYGPAAGLVNVLKDRPLLKMALASWMALQIEKLNWPLPDLIIPFPRSFISRFHEGYNRSQVLAEGLRELFKIPVQNLLSKKSSPGLDQFRLKKSAQLSDLTILLVVETLHSREAIDACAKVIREGFPKAIYVLGLTLLET